MKVYLSRKKTNSVSPLVFASWIFFWREIEYNRETYMWAERWFRPIINLAKWVLDWVNPTITYVRVDNYDVHNAHATLATVILPVLVRYQEVSISVINVDDDDVPIEIFEDIEDGEHRKRRINEVKWKWLLNELVWTFKQIRDGHDYPLYVLTQSEIIEWRERKKNALRLFGKYFEHLWC